MPALTQHGYTTPFEPPVWSAGTPRACAEEISPPILHHAERRPGDPVLPSREKPHPDPETPYTPPEPGPTPPRHPGQPEPGQPVEPEPDPDTPEREPDIPAPPA